MSQRLPADTIHEWGRAWPAIVIAMTALAGLMVLVLADALSMNVALASAAALIGATAVVAIRVRRSANLLPATSSRAPPAADHGGLALSALIEALVEQFPDVLFILDRRLGIIDANAAARTLFGPRLKGKHLTAALRHPLVVETVEAVAAGAGATSVDFTSPVPVERHFRAHVAPLAHAGVAAVLVVLQDMTGVRRVEQMRVDFVANASHELRTPLSVLIGFIETLRGPARDDTEARERFLEIMQEQASRMGRLLNDLLSLSRIELNEHRPPTGRVDLADVVREVTAALSPIAAQANLAVRIELAPHLPPVIGERDELYQVFQNLLDNAIKHGSGRGGVTVSRRESAETMGTLALAVSDCGAGIPREHIPRLTERFYRVDDERSRERGGTGLGLAIVKHILNRHGGRLLIDSQVGKGSTFTVILPRADVAGNQLDEPEDTARRSA